MWRWASSGCNIHRLGILSLGGFGVASKPFPSGLFGVAYLANLTGSSKKSLDLEMTCLSIQPISSGSG